MDRGVPIRSISRCITVLQAINRQGSLSLMEIARKSRLPYPTACRIIQTLMHEGLVECETTRKWYRATGLVHSLSQGFDNRDALIAGARPVIVALTCKVGWPLVITTRVGQSMVVRDTTHDLTALTSNLYPAGCTLPLLDSSPGQAYLAHLDEPAWSAAIDAVRKGDRGAASTGIDLAQARTRIRADGFVACAREPHAGGVEQTASISVPLQGLHGVDGVLTVVFFASSLDMDAALRRYLPELRSAADAIRDALRSAAGVMTGEPEVAKARAAAAPTRTAVLSS